MGQWVHKRMGDVNETTRIWVIQVSPQSYIPIPKVMIWSIDKLNILKSVDLVGGGGLGGGGCNREPI